MTLDKNAIALVGAGNVATHLARALKDNLTGIYSRNIDHAQALAEPLHLPAYDDFAYLRQQKPSIILVSVADKALPHIAEAIGPLDWNPLVLHTSGTVGMEVLGCISPRTGVLYPLQTFSAGAYVDLSEVPFFTETSKPEDLPIVDSLAYTISRHVHHADAAHRRTLHIAGVFTSNFTNILLESVERILATPGYPLEVVKPLIEATVAKAFAVGPHAAQTGPARRGDFEVIQRQKEALPEDLKPVYSVLTDLILRSHHINEQN